MFVFIYIEMFNYGIFLIIFCKVIKKLSIIIANKTLVYIKSIVTHFFINVKSEKIILSLINLFLNFFK